MSFLNSAWEWILTILIRHGDCCCEFHEPSSRLLSRSVPSFFFTGLLYSDLSFESEHIVALLSMNSFLLDVTDVQGGIRESSYEGGWSGGVNVLSKGKRNSPIAAAFKGLENVRLSFFRNGYFHFLSLSWYYTQIFLLTTADPPLLPLVRQQASRIRL